MNIFSKHISTYDDIASEYYDPIRHPTCANFAELSHSFLAPRIQKIANSVINILEVGAGRSMVAPIVAAQGLSLAKVTLLDASPRMLEYSREWERKGAHIVVGDASDTGLRARSFQLIVSSLGDPYNSPRFWHEIERLLEQNGTCLFTTPAHEWAERFRDGSELEAAEFLLTSGATVLVRSDIPQIERQIEIIDATGLSVVETRSLTTDDLSQPVSPKLLVSQPTDRLPIVRGFTVVKRQQMTD